MSLSARLAAIADGCQGVTWGMAVRSATGELLGAHGEDTVLSTASMGKVLLLVEAASQMADGALAEDEPLDRRSVEPVADSGLWQHLAVDVLPAPDACVLVGSVSDNLATNVLLDRVGLSRVTATGTELGLRATALHDRVRDVRGPRHPARLSSGTAGELAQLFAALDAGAVRGPAVSARVRGWLGTGADLSMAAGAYSLDPLARSADDRGVVLVHKTGTDAGVRADAGVVRCGDRAVAYAVVANWPAAEDRRDAVHAALRAFGGELRALVPPRSASAGPGG